MSASKDRLTDRQIKDVVRFIRTEVQKQRVVQAFALRRFAKAARANYNLIDFAPVAQLDRVSGFEPEGRRFESCRVYHYYQ